MASRPGYMKVPVGPGGIGGFVIRRLSNKAPWPQMATRPKKKKSDSDSTDDEVPDKKQKTESAAAGGGGGGESTDNKTKESNLKNDDLKLNATAAAAGGGDDIKSSSALSRAAFLKWPLGSYISPLLLPESSSSAAAAPPSSSAASSASAAVAPSSAASAASSASTGTPVNLKCSSFTYGDNKSLDQSLICPITLHPIYDPVTHLLCGNTYCRACLTASKNCLHCNAEVKTSDITTSPLIVRNMLSGVVVICTDCKIEVKRDQLISAHHAICPNHLVECSASDIGCKWQIIRSELKTHESKCTYVTVAPVVRPIIDKRVEVALKEKEREKQPHEITIPDFRTFSQTQKAHFDMSKTLSFSRLGYTWHLRMYWGGTNWPHSNSKKSPAFFVYLENYLGIPIPVNITFVIHHPSGDIFQNWVNTHVHTFTKSDDSGIHAGSFNPPPLFDTIFENFLFPDGSLHFSCDLRAIQ